MEKGASCEASVAVSVCVLATTLWFSLAHSEEQKGVVRLPTVTVEGTPETPERTRGESQARKEIQRTPGGVALISSQEIKETRATALQDVLDFVPGVMIRPALATSPTKVRYRFAARACVIIIISVA